MAVMRNSGIKDSTGDRMLMTGIYICLAIILLLVLYPLLWVVSASVSDPFMIRQGKLWLMPVGFQLKGYQLAFSDSEILLGYRNSLFYMIAGTAINIFLTTIAAFPLSCKDFKARNVLALFFSFTMWFNGGIIPNYMLMKSLGFTNTVWSVLISSAVSVWNLIIMRNYFTTSIPDELREAAKIDGCTNVGYLFRIAIRLVGPIMAVLVVFYGVARWNDFFSALIYITKRTLYPLQLFLREILIINQMTSAQQNVATDSTMTEMLLAAESVKYAVIIIASLPVMIIYPFVQRYMLSGITVGAIKG